MNVAWSARKVAADAAAVCYLFEWIFDAVFMKIFETRGSLLQRILLLQYLLPL